MNRDSFELIRERTDEEKDAVLRASQATWDHEHLMDPVR